ncbi:ricin-type beta-trefoil lectin domain protein [Streptomyces sp. NPDC052092]|uniref:ricin-type beta-trefoil lectin domain protein n=1 Tax=Streptomyces sp. NPDC052092 TaxID=3365685 RepID=UPI0037D0DCD0
MSLWTSLEPASTTVDPGAGTTVRLRVRNTGDVVDEYRFEPVGDLAPWARVEPPSLRLYPGTTGTVEVSFTIPRSPDAAAGPHPYAVRITPTEHPEATTVPEGNLTVTPFTEVRAELVPPVVKGRLRGKPVLAVDNVGNTKVTASLSGSDNGDQLSFDLDPGNVQIEPGRAAFVKARLKPREIIWFGSKQERPYTLTVQRSGVDPLGVEGKFVQRGFLPGWLATVLGMTVALAVAFVVIWLTYKPDVRSLATEKTAQTEAAAIPAPDPSASAPITLPSAGASQPEQPPQQEKPAGTGGAPDSGGSGEKEEEKPASGGGGGGGGGQKQQSPPQPLVGSFIVGVGSDRCVTVPLKKGKAQDGTGLALQDCDPKAPNQRWEFLDDTSVRSMGMCMDVAWGSRDDGALIQLARCTTNPAQDFVMSGAADLVNPQADKCVDAMWSGTANGTGLHLWTCGGTPNQKWQVRTP